MKIENKFNLVTKWKKKNEKEKKVSVKNNLLYNFLVEFNILSYTTLYNEWNCVAFFKSFYK